MDQTGACYDEPELDRLRGELLRRQAVLDAAPAEACFQRALAIARRQQAKSWELRAAMSLARLWQQAVTRYLETLEQIVYADALGFDIAWLAELHFYRPFSILSSPLIPAAALAQRRFAEEVMPAVRGL
jgi:hypothetical protein